MIEGKNVIGISVSNESGKIIKSVNPATQEILEGDFYVSSQNEIERAVSLANDAYKDYRKISGKERGKFLREIGNQIELIAEELTQRACQETGLPEGRINGERGRTIGQLNLFADLIEEGSWVEASLDTPIPDRSPIPKPDIRKMMVPVGPVVVFTASNFPLAFSTAGGDTASALAAGNPVIIKAHDSHLGTNELVAKAIRKAATITNMPEGVFSSLNGDGFKTGEQLVLHDAVKSVAFTGSLSGGKALFDLASKRKEPIPVFSEMGSINPVVLFPEKLQNESEDLAKNYAGSITLGSGQFCTNPGLILGIKSDELDAFEKLLVEELSKISVGVMLNEGISNNYSSAIKKIHDQINVEIKLGDKEKSQPALGVVNGDTFLANPNLAEEVFGPYSLLVKCKNSDQLDEIISTLSGQLTCTLMVSTGDLEKFKSTILTMRDTAGRVIFNGLPTGVEVTHSMHHGGEFPASTDSRFTSVGTDAIKRFVRPLCFQNCPNEMLPNELKDGNPLNIWRKVDGQFQK